MSGEYANWQSLNPSATTGRFPSAAPPGATGSGQGPRTGLGCLPAPSEPAEP